MAERVLAVDPGESVGWARADLHADGRITDIRQGVHQLKDFALALYGGIPDYDTVIYETWRLYPHMAKKLVGNDMQPAQLVGIIRFLAWLHPQVKLVSQGANLKSTGEKAMPPVLRKRLRHSSQQHDKDALYHLGAYWHKHYAGGSDGTKPA